MTTHTKSKCKVMFAQCSGNSAISSCNVCVTLLNSEDVPTVRSISISQILVLPDITDDIVLSIFSVFSAHVSSHASPRFHQPFTRFLPRSRLITPPTVIISDPTERRSRNRVHDCRIALKVAAVAWYSLPKSYLEIICCFCSVFLI